MIPKKRLLVASLMATLVACSKAVGAPSLSATPVYTPTRDLSRTSVPIEASPTAFLPPTTLEPSNSASPLSARGPWLSYWNDDGNSPMHYVINPDASGKVELGRCEGCAWPAISTASPHIAFVETSHARPCPTGTCPAAELVVLNVPSMAEASRIDLLQSPSLLTGEAIAQTALFKILELDSPAWSPDGQALAFVAARDAANLDLYLLDVPTGSIRRLSSGPNQASQPIWSPDGTAVIHREVTSFSIGPDCEESAIWAASTSDDGNVRLFDPDGCMEFLDWVGPATMVTYEHRWDPSRGLPLNHLRVTSIATGATRVICRDVCDLSMIAIDPVRRAAVYQKMPFEDWYVLRLDTMAEALIPSASGLNAPAWNQIAQRLVFASPLDLVSALCPASGDFPTVEPSGGLACTHIEVTDATFPSPDGEWILSPNSLIDRAGEAVLTFPRIDGLVDVIWRPDSLGAAMISSGSLSYVEVPGGQPQLLDRGGAIYSVTWITTGSEAP